MASRGGPGRVCLLGLSLVPGLLPACTLHRFTLSAEDVQRASRELADREETLVRAYDEEGESVSLRLERGTWLWPLSSEGEDLADGEWLAVDDADDVPPTAGWYAYDHRNQGAALLAAGLAGFLGAYLLQTLYALDGPEYAIPVAGPIFWIRDGAQEGGAYVAGLVGSPYLLLLELGGLACLIASAATWQASPPDRLSAPSRAAGELTLTVEPLMTGAGAGGALTLRF